MERVGLREARGEDGLEAVAEGSGLLDLPSERRRSRTTRCRRAGTSGR
jgi:hypothetical protein